MQVMVMQGQLPIAALDTRTGALEQVGTLLCGTQRLCTNTRCECSPHTRWIVQYSEQVCRLGVQSSTGLGGRGPGRDPLQIQSRNDVRMQRSEEHTSELQSLA